jgi:hypothetical protein
MSTIGPMVMGRGPRRFAPALAAALGLAAVLSAGALARGGDSVLVATTGSNSEMVKTVPITKNPGGQPRVVMSMRPSDVPSLLTGDRLDLTAEMQVTADCRTRQPRCAGRPYRFNPAVTAELLVADSANVAEAGGGRAISLERRNSTCLARLPNREHHCMTVFTGTGLDVDTAELPCPPASCHLNLTLRAHSGKAKGGEKLIVGTNLPDGSIRQDKGRINAVRLSPGSQPAIDPLVSEDRITTRLIPRMKQRVIYSQKLNGLEQGEQLAVKAKMRTGIGHLPYNTLVSSVLVLTEGRRDTNPSALAERVGSSNGEISERNGFNCTQRRTPCTTRKVGVLSIRDDAIRNGDPRPLFVNLVTYANAKRADSRAQDRVKVLGGGRLEVTRYPKALRG